MKFGIPLDIHESNRNSQDVLMKVSGNNRKRLLA